MLTEIHRSGCSLPVRCSSVQCIGAAQKPQDLQVNCRLLYGLPRHPFCKPLSNLSSSYPPFSLPPTGPGRRKASSSILDQAEGFRSPVTVAYSDAVPPSSLFDEDRPSTSATERIEVGRPTGWQERETRQWLSALHLAPTPADEAAPFLDNPLRNGILLARIATVVEAAAGSKDDRAASTAPAHAPRDMRAARANILSALDRLGLLSMADGAAALASAQLQSPAATPAAAYPIPSGSGPFQAAFRAWAAASPSREPTSPGRGRTSQAQPLSPRKATSAEAPAFTLRLKEGQLAIGLGLTAEVERILQGDGGAIWGLLTYIRLTAMRPTRLYSAVFSRIDTGNGTAGSPNHAGASPSRRPTSGGPARASSVPHGRGGVNGSTSQLGSDSPTQRSKGVAAARTVSRRDTLASSGTRPMTATSSPISAARMAPAPTYAEMLTQRREVAVAAAAVVPPPKPTGGEAAWLAAAAAAAAVPAAAKSAQYVDLDMAYDSSSGGRQGEVSPSRSRPVSVPRLHR